jgi:hypothetical protein
MGAQMLEAPVELMSPNASLFLPLRPPLEIDDPRSGKRVAEPGVAVKFENGMAKVTDAETWELLQRSKHFTGQGAPKRVFLKGELMQTPSGPIGLTHGALTAATAKARPAPTPDWNEAGAVDLAKRIAEGQVKDLEAALAFELAGKRRKTVARALTDALLGDEKADQPEAVPVLPPAAAPVPAGQGGF